MGRYVVERKCFDIGLEGDVPGWAVLRDVEAESHRAALLAVVAADTEPRQYADHYTPSEFGPGRYRVVEHGSGMSFVREYDVADATRRTVADAPVALPLVEDKAA